MTYDIFFTTHKKQDPKEAAEESAFHFCAVTVWIYSSGEASLWRWTPKDCFFVKNTIAKLAMLCMARSINVVNISLINFVEQVR